MTGPMVSSAERALLDVHAPPAEGVSRERWALRVACGVQDPASWLSANDRTGWQRRARLTSAWRTAAGWSARAGLRAVQLQRAHIYAVVHHGDHQRRDPANSMPTVKAVVDGLVDVGVLPDDDWRHLEGPDVRLGSPTGWARRQVMDPPMAAMTLLVTDLGPALTKRPT